MRVWKRAFYREGWSHLLIHFLHSTSTSTSSIYSTANQLKTWFGILCKTHRNWLSVDAMRTRLTTFPSHTNSVITCLLIHPTSNVLIIGSESPTVSIHDLSTGRLIRHLHGHEGGVWAMQVCGSAADLLVTGCVDRTVRVFDLNTGALRRVLRGHASTIRCLKVIPRPILAVPVTGKSSSGGRERRRSAGRGGTEWSHVLSEWHESEHEMMVLSGSRDKSVRAWTLPRDSAQLGQSEFGVPEEQAALWVMDGHGDSVRDLDVQGPVGVTASYDHTLRVWNLVTGECVHVLRGHANKVYQARIVLDHSHPSSSLAGKHGQNNTKHVVVSGSLDQTIRIWNLRTGECLAILDGHAGLVGLLEIVHVPWNRFPMSPYATREQRDALQSRWALSGRDGATVIVSGSADTTLKVWDLEVAISHSTTLVNTSSHLPSPALGVSTCSSPIELASLDSHANPITTFHCFSYTPSTLSSSSHRRPSPSLRPSTSTFSFPDLLVSGSEGHVKLWDLHRASLVRNLGVRVDSAWRVTADWRRCVAAVQRDGTTVLEVWDFYPDE